MTMIDVAASVRSIEARLRALGVERVYLFGSAARGDDHGGSDIDVFVDPAPGTRFGFARYFDVKDALEEALARPVDLGTRAMLHPTLRPEIERDAVRVL